MKSRDAELRSYYRQTVRMLPCARKIRAGLKERLHTDITDYLSEHPDATAQTVREQFGSPESIAAAYVETMGAEELLQKLRLHDRIVRGVIVVLAIASLIGCAIAIWAEIALQKAMQGTIYVITEVEDNPHDDAYWETWETTAYYP